jgi:hypothetical protein
LAILSTCPKHGSVLRDRCHRCSATISPHRARQIWVCHQCLADLRRGPRAAGDATALEFEALLERTLADGIVRWPEIREYHPLACFALIRQVLRVLSTGPRSQRLRAIIAKRWGGDPAAPAFPSGGRDLGTLSSSDRHRLISLLARIMPGWPFRYVGACLEARVFSSWALHDFHGSSYAYSEPVRAYLYRRDYQPNHAEVSAARAYLLRSGRNPSGSALRRLLGVDSVRFGDRD